MAKEKTQASNIDRDWLTQKDTHVKVESKKLSLTEIDVFQRLDLKGHSQWFELQREKVAFTWQKHKKTIISKVGATGIDCVLF